MRIAFFVRCMSGGGAEKVAAQLTHIWNELGHEIVVLTCLPPELKEYAFKHYAREWVDRGALKTESALRTLYERHCFDVAIFNDAINSDWFENALLTVKSFGVKTIVINHHTANNWMYGCGNTRELGMDGALMQADVMVCVDKMWALWWHHRGCRSFYIPNPVSVKAGSMINGKDKDPFLLVWVGRLMDWAKQPDKMVKAFVEINRHVPSARLVMLGTKTKSVERILLKNVPREMRDKIEMPGFVTNADEYMHRAALHVFTSLTEVTVPQVVMEAQALSVPTVALDMPVLRGVPGVSVAGNEAEFVEMVVNRLHGQKDDDHFKTRHFDDEDVPAYWNDLFVALQSDTICELACREREKWQAVEEYDMLLDELHRSQVYFTQKYLPEYMKWRRWSKRMDPRYLFNRLFERVFK